MIYVYVNEGLKKLTEVKADKLERLRIADRVRAYIRGPPTVLYCICSPC